MKAAWDFLLWLITRHLLPYGLIASGKENVEARERQMLTELSQTFPTLLPRWTTRTSRSQCEVCGEELLGYRKLRLCRRLSCYRKSRKK